MTPPRVFISYAWGDEDAWVEEFARRLRVDGVDARLDRWELHPGDEIAAFMEEQVRESAFVLFICTPRFKAKADERKGGVGYEAMIATAEVMAKRAEVRRKFIPVHRSGAWEEAAPSWLLGRLSIDFQSPPNYDASYIDLVSTLCGARSIPPPVQSIRETPTTVSDGKRPGWHSRMWTAVGTMAIASGLFASMDGEDFSLFGPGALPETPPLGEAHPLEIVRPERSVPLWSPAGRILAHRGLDPGSFVSLHLDSLGDQGWADCIEEGSLTYKISNYTASVRPREGIVDISFTRKVNNIQELGFGLEIGDRPSCPMLQAFHTEALGQIVVIWSKYDFGCNNGCWMINIDIVTLPSDKWSSDGVSQLLGHSMIGFYEGYPMGARAQPSQAAGELLIGPGRNGPAAFVMLLVGHDPKLSHEDFGEGQFADLDVDATLPKIRGFRGGTSARRPGPKDEFEDSDVYAVDALMCEVGLSRRCFLLFESWFEELEALPESPEQYFISSYK